MPRPNDGVIRVMSDSKIHKMLQSLAIFSSYACVVNSGMRLRRTELHKAISEHFFGIEGKCASQIMQMMIGEGNYFSKLWVQPTGGSGLSVVRLDFSPTTWVRRTQIPQEILKMTTLGRAKRVISGKSLWNKGKEIHGELNKCYAIWREFLINGKLPSGKNASDAAEFVLNRLWEEELQRRRHGGLVVNDDEDFSDQEGVVEMENSDDVEEVDEEECSDSVVFSSIEDVAVESGRSRPEHFRPTFWWVFLLFGPYSAEEFDTQIHPLLALDSDKIIRDVTMGRKHARGEEDKKMRDADRAADNNRGIPEIQHISALQREESNMLQSVELNLAAISTSMQGWNVQFTCAKQLYDMTRNEMYKDDMILCHLEVKKCQEDLQKIRQRINMDKRQSTYNPPSIINVDDGINSEKRAADDNTAVCTPSVNKRRKMMITPRASYVNNIHHFSSAANSCLHEGGQRISSQMVIDVSSSCTSSVPQHQGRAANAKRGLEVHACN